MVCPTWQKPSQTVRSEEDAARLRKSILVVSKVLVVGSYYRQQSCLSHCATSLERLRFG
jgi:hypothetical protein